jgi:hypothetical protein
MHYRLVYLCNGYTLADAFRPSPTWGKRSFSAELEDGADDADVIRAAKETCPKNFWLHQVEAICGKPHTKRPVFFEPVPGSVAASEGVKP